MQWQKSRPELGSWLPRSHFRQHRRFAVIELPSDHDYPQWSAVDGETGKFHGSHSRRRASPLRQEAGRGKEGVVSLRSSGCKSCVHHLTSESMSQDFNRRGRLS